jgi:hypothetical protein
MLLKTDKQISLIESLVERLGHLFIYLLLLIERLGPQLLLSSINHFSILF